VHRWFSFHGGHSGAWCRHAQGSLRDVLEVACVRGFTTFGLSEHAPRDFDEDLFPDEQDLTPADLQEMFLGYAAEARSLRGELADRLEVFVGFEAEWIRPERDAERMRAIFSEGGFDYFVGSVHHVDGTIIDESAARSESVARRLGGRVELERAYFDAVAAMVEALRPPVVGHLDLVRKFRGGDVAFGEAVAPALGRALEAVAGAGALLEINAAPARKRTGPVYPQPALLERAREMGIGVTLGDDSHGPADVGVGLQASVEAAARAGYRAIACLARRDGAVVAEAVPLEAVAPAVR